MTKPDDLKTKMKKIEEYTKISMNETIVGLEALGKRSVIVIFNDRGEIEDASSTTVAPDLLWIAHSEEFKQLVENQKGRNPFSPQPPGAVPPPVTSASSSSSQNANNTQASENRSTVEFLRLAARDLRRRYGLPMQFKDIGNSIGNMNRDQLEKLLVSYCTQGWLISEHLLEYLLEKGYDCTNQSDNPHKVYWNPKKRPYFVSKIVLGEIDRRSSEEVRSTKAKNLPPRRQKAPEQEPHQKKHFVPPEHNSLASYHNQFDDNDDTEDELDAHGDDQVRGVDAFTTTIDSIREGLAAGRAGGIGMPGLRIAGIGNGAKRVAATQAAIQKGSLAKDTGGSILNSLTTGPTTSSFSALSSTTLTSSASTSAITVVDPGAMEAAKKKRPPAKKKEAIEGVEGDAKKDPKKRKAGATEGDSAGDDAKRTKKVPKKEPVNVVAPAPLSSPPSIPPLTHTVSLYSAEEVSSVPFASLLDNVDGVVDKTSAKFKHRNRTRYNSDALVAGAAPTGADIAPSQPIPSTTSSASGDAADKKK